MKKTFLLFFMITAVVATTFAGGLLTNSNQSTQYVRMLSRNASLQIDGVYFNPAGLIKLADGWHFALDNQTIWQDKTVYSAYPYLNDGNYLGTVRVPVFPNAYAVYKNKNWAFSFGLGPNAGGGSADFKEGLPTFEIPISQIAPALSGLSLLPSPAKYVVSGYNADISFQGSSIFWGFQLGATYKVNEIFSGYLGLRYLPSVNSYKGEISNIQLNVNGQLVNAKTWMTGTAAPTISGIAAQASGAATSYNGAATSVQQLISGGAGNYTLAQVQNAGYITAAQRAAFEAALANLSLSAAQIAALNMNQVKTYFSTAATTYQSTAKQLSDVVDSISINGAKLGDKKVDTRQTGAGWTPIIGVNISPSENLNIAFRYEHKTRLELTNDTKTDDIGMFENGGKTRSDVPGIFAAGIGYRPFKWLETQVSYNLYLDKGVNWGINVRESGTYNRTVQREIDHNYYELALGLQFNLNDKFALSTGFLTSQPGVKDSYQSDFSFTNPSVTVAGGFQWKLTQQLTLDAGVLNTYYKDETVSYQDSYVPGGKYSDTFGKSTFILSAGLSYSIFK